MEIRVECVAGMEEGDSPASPRGERPPSPCESEISVGCEGEARQAQPSPMDMTTHADTSTEDEETEPRSPSTSRGAPSPTLSSGSLHTESFTYLSDDEYFRPLKRLAMSGTSPPPSREPLSPQRDQEPKASSPSPSPEPEEPQEPQEAGALAGRGEMAGGDQKQAAGLRSFSILDILSYKPSRRKSSIPVKIVRPWDTREEAAPEPHAKPASQSEKKGGANDKGSALDALFKMTNKTLDNLNKDEKTGKASHIHTHTHTHIHTHTHTHTHPHTHTHTHTHAHIHTRPMITSRTTQNNQVLFYHKHNCKQPLFIAVITTTTTPTITTTTTTTTTTTNTKHKSTNERNAKKLNTNKH
ncbi:hypothetical protein E2C01_045188 [Portunus trituberculatus]|uniref:Uncharacterized protein n=1 Tax=Portunus trituberculatus TaxID=210409 RepID=A0A5B7G4C8_PORTR|nr:hypothetical protein [Portunus trituberculatus]